MGRQRCHRPPSAIATPRDQRPVLGPLLTTAGHWDSAQCHCLGTQPNGERAVAPRGYGPRLQHCGERRPVTQGTVSDLQPAAPTTGTAQLVDDQGVRTRRGESGDVLSPFHVPEEHIDSDQHSCPDQCGDNFYCHGCAFQVAREARQTAPLQRRSWPMQCACIWKIPPPPTFSVISRRAALVRRSAPLARSTLFAMLLKNEGS
jgi:hypothetical protein